MRLRAQQALKSQLSFAEFVLFAETWCDEMPSSVDPKIAAQYRDAWFELEIVNALALEAWDSDGRPRDWDDQWCDLHKDEAEEVLVEFLVLLGTFNF
ncbi:hypothetical protein PTE30175_00075 [Pandoraea terrae]|uniref:Uncharacterized protein n=1 Tax=Pandoraea terrae TaxID=1537710 RepID=A0A5E4RB77_9BURK|nr:hypothetical protein [Pandoraea terrae]VVD60510.1 hypothetical protein PTE30175_00075 [Pandoraea terrae]